VPSFSLNEKVAELGSPESAQFVQRAKGQVHSPGKVGVDCDARREDVQMRMVHATDALASLGAAVPVLEHQWRQHPSVRPAPGGWPPASLSRCSNRSGGNWRE